MKSSIIHISTSATSVLYEGIGEDTFEQVFTYNGKIVLTQVRVSLTQKEVFRTVPGERFVKKVTANGEVTLIESDRKEFERYSCSGVLEFRIGPDELLLGLGQYEDGFYDYRGRTEYLYQSNMRIAIPFLITTGHYAIWIDSESDMIFSEKDGIIRFEIDTLSSLSYTVFTGDTLDELIMQFQQQTGIASMLPRWAFGYIQSRERYQTSEEILQTAEQFRKRKIPVSCIVQDWYSWREGLWGEKTFDPGRYPDPKQMVDTLHASGIRFMVSVWPNMSPESSDYKKFADRKLLLPNSNVYDAYSPEAGTLYFEQCQRQILSSGADALWCDNAEPFSDADWSGAVKKSERDRFDCVVELSKKSIVWENLNSYGAYHARNIYENWRRAYPEKRVVNLIRSGYTESRRCGTILWSGDITAKWTTMRNQLTEGLKMGLSGHPYWTFDIGGFFVVKDKYENRGCCNTSAEPLWFWDGDYNDGVQDQGYCELYTRWLQFGTFLPVFRSHGTDTPREPWQFEKETESDAKRNVSPDYYDIICRYIRLRYRLMPYIYSLAAMAHFDSFIMMRSLAFDFPEDPQAVGRSDEYMFGPALLIAPVFSPMYFKSESRPLSDVPKTREVYLPRGAKWYDFWTEEVFEGGQTVTAVAPLDRIPVFVRAGSILPMLCEDKISGAWLNREENRAMDEIDEIRVYTGADGHFTYYCDDGDGYGYKKGEYCRVQMQYSDRDRTLRMQDKQGKMKEPNVRNIRLIDAMKKS